MGKKANLLKNSEIKPPPPCSLKQRIHSDNNKRSSPLYPIYNYDLFDTDTSFCIPRASKRSRTTLQTLSSFEKTTTVTATRINTFFYESEEVCVSSLLKEDSFGWFVDLDIEERQSSNNSCSSAINITKYDNQLQKELPYQVPTAPLSSINHAAEMEQAFAADTIDSVLIW